MLAGALLLLALIAYACRPSGEESGEPTRSDAGIEASPSVSPTEPSADASEEPEADPSEGARESADPSDDAEDSGGSAAGDGGSAEGGEGGEVPAPERPEDVCRPQDIVVTFEYAEEDQEVYGSGANPGFKITVVNTAEQTCTVDVGGEAMEIRIHSGDDRIFSTADCAENKSAEKRQISRGVPHEYTFTWERMRSFEDCRGTEASAQPGWYRANLHGDYAGDQPELPFQLKA
ncbi:hypothetical protein NGM33_20485 [Nocardiopsis dassonvillei]|uniref:hypothetical protein n=1 Tax=Nocardiopsis dassonvillei TaxID=2014 RepID=UPI0020A3A99E|nr:hypothetical protein [Nocardiopsis dassonvillei]MCP3015708.1 hypothetical protein [Nocardiopsis dassonvillei]